MVDMKALTRRLHKLHDRVSQVEKTLMGPSDFDAPTLRIELGQIAIGVMHIMTDLDKMAPAATIIDVGEVTSPGNEPPDTDEFD